MFKILLMVLASLLIFSCKSAPPVYRETRIVDTVLSAAPPAIRDTLTVQVADTIISADRIIRGDTVIKIRYYPRQKTLTVYVKPDTVRLKYRDTTVTFKEGESPDGFVPWWSWILIVLALLLVMLVVVKCLRIQSGR